MPVAAAYCNSGQLAGVRSKPLCSHHANPVYCAGSRRLALMNVRRRDNAPDSPERDQRHGGIAGNTSRGRFISQGRRYRIRLP